jgi:hypothetical protein
MESLLERDMFGKSYDAAIRRVNKAITKLKQDLYSVESVRGNCRM